MSKASEWPPDPIRPLPRNELVRDTALEIIWQLIGNPRCSMPYRLLIVSIYLRTVTIFYIIEVNRAIILPGAFQCALSLLEAFRKV